MQIPRWLTWIATTWTALFWSFCIGTPLGFILFPVLFPALLHADSKGVSQSIWDLAVLNVAGATFLQALCSTFISAVLGTALGVWIRSPSSGSVSAQGHFLRPASSHWTYVLLSIPYGIPTVVAAQAWVMWLGRSGVLASFGCRLDWMYSLKAVILAHVFFNVPFVALMVSQAKLEVPRQQIEAAELSGANAWNRFRYIEWPYIKWSAAGSWAQVLALCAMSFGLILILGGGPPVQTLEVEIFQRLRTGSVDLSGAVICGFWELLITLTPWALVLYFNSKKNEFLSGLNVDCVQGASIRTQSSRFRNILEVGLALFFILPYGIVLNRDGLVNLFDPIWQSQVTEPLKFSLLLAFLTSVVTLITVVMALLCLRYLKKSPKLHALGAFLLGIPSGVSVLVLGLGAWMAYGQWVDPFEGSLGMIVALQVTLAFPISFRMLFPLLKGIQVSELEGAALLGAHPIRAFWLVEWPRWKGQVIRVLGLSAAISLGELGAVSLFYSENLIPLPLLVSRLMQQYRFDEAQGVAGLLFILCILSTFLVRFSPYLEPRNS